ncbi:electron transfer flavoprotein subunit alpha/FixB family protein [Photobacterium sp. DNB23_23_1]|uniref:FAD-binding protein n=1 Tax=Photobacterium pectinilyticum TaxID=2906793 RepID=A0ABT1MWU5_9GAMM|nr:FAD-binding protein [Photobacterium sp. ZSDE20]MCQ1056956.1 FAD-binding protein [Photobacterium sp. ZSDE20]MDD1821091.1 FAD-binding protein [Photobacterium sp. ZSDE20]
MTILVIAEHDNHRLGGETLKSVGAVSTLQQSIDVLVIGSQCQSVIEEASSIGGITRVLVADNLNYKDQLAENCAQLIAELAKDYSHIVAPATTFGKNLLPRVAALLDVGVLSDVVTIESEDTVIRPIYAGNALARVRSRDSKVLMTLRGSAFDAASLGNTQAEQKRVDIAIGNDLSEFVERQVSESERPELTAARVVISGGRALGSKENFGLIEQLADKLDGAIGASRAAVDAGYISNDFQVGQTGKIVAPELYIAVGISGAIQHLAGMKDAKVIVAINSDPEAPIFDIADYGLVGDLFDILPELIDSV